MNVKVVSTKSAQYRCIVWENTPGQYEGLIALRFIQAGSLGKDLSIIFRYSWDMPEHIVHLGDYIVLSERGLFVVPKEVAIRLFDMSTTASASAIPDRKPATWSLHNLAS